MTDKTKSLIIFGSSVFSELLWSFFVHDSDYKPVAFTVDKEFLSEQQFCGLPVFPFEQITETHPPQSHELFVAVGYKDNNRFRKRKIQEAKAKGYTLARYKASSASIWPNAVVGENCCIMEGVIIQPFVTIGAGTVITGGGLIGNHAKVGENCFIGSRAICSGQSKLGEGCMIGAGATIANEVSIGDYAVIGGNCLITKNVLPWQVYTAPKAILRKCSSEGISF